MDAEAGTRFNRPAEPRGRADRPEQGEDPLSTPRWGFSLSRESPWKVVLAACSAVYVVLLLVAVAAILSSEEPEVGRLPTILFAAVGGLVLMVVIAPVVYLIWSLVRATGVDYDGTLQRPEEPSRPARTEATPPSSYQRLDEAQERPPGA
jgi:hypothetical protein